jgi:hypothetical protein
MDVICRYVKFVGLYRSMEPGIGVIVMAEGRKGFGVGFPLSVGEVSTLYACLGCRIVMADGIGLLWNSAGETS